MPKKTIVETKASLLYTDEAKEIEIPTSLKLEPEFESLAKTPKEFQELYAKADTERIERTEKASNVVCRKYVPKLYTILKNSGYPIDLAMKTVIHFTVNRGWWKLVWVKEWLPVETRDPKKRNAAYESVRVKKEKKDKARQELEEKTIDTIAEDLSKKHGLANLSKPKRRAIAKTGYEARKQIEPQMEKTNGILSAAQRWGTMNVLIHNEEHLQLVKAHEESLQKYGTGTYAIRLHNGEFERAEPKQDSPLENTKRESK